MVNVTLGRLSDGESLCFFAVGSDRGPIAITGTKVYSIVADGIALLSRGARRIGTSTAAARADWATGVITLDFAINTTSPPFGTIANFNGLGMATARLSFTRDGSISGAVSAPGGFTGTITGRFFEFGMGAGLVFDLTSPSGDRMYGSLALDTL